MADRRPRGRRDGRRDDAPRPSAPPPSPAQTSTGLPVPTGDGVRIDAIRARAYELYLARDGAPGSALDDWLAAERALGGS